MRLLARLFPAGQINVWFGEQTRGSPPTALCETNVALHGGHTPPKWLGLQCAKVWIPSFARGSRYVHLNAAQPSPNPKVGARWRRFN